MNKYKVYDYVLDCENADIDKNKWATLVYVMEEREWTIEEEEEGDE